MGSTTDYPKKLFYRIQEVADIVGVEAYVLRYWETKFPMLSPEKDTGDQRRYRQKDIELLLKIRELLYTEKFTIAGAVEQLKREARGGSRRTAAPERPTPTNGDAPQADMFPEQEDAAAQGLSEDQRERLGDIRNELGLLKRELENWRDELA